MNNIYTEYIKIKIKNYTLPSFSGIKLKISHSEISIGDKINFDDILTFEPVNTGALPDEYILEFFPYVEETEVKPEYYGECQEGDFKEIGIFSKYAFNINYIMQCHENWETCYQFGLDFNYYCAKNKLVCLLN